jgi:hypothetical protein
MAKGSLDAGREAPLRAKPAALPDIDSVAGRKRRGVAGGRRSTPGASVVPGGWEKHGSATAFRPRPCSAHRAPITSTAQLEKARLSSERHVP